MTDQGEPSNVEAAVSNMSLAVSGSTPSIERLESPSDYNDSKFLMRMYLVHDGLSECISNDHTYNIFVDDYTRKCFGYLS